MLKGHRLKLFGNLPPYEEVVTEHGCGHLSLDFSKLKAGRYHFRLGFEREEEVVLDPDGYNHVMVNPKRTGDLRLYTLLPNISGTIDDWLVDLEHIADLGFNMVHFLPITPMDTSESPYSARSFYGVDSRYLKSGGASLENLADKATQLGLGLCFDLVLNHVGVNSDMVKRCPDWIQSDQERSDGFKRAGCVTGEGWLTWEDLVLIHYDHPNPQTRDEIWNYMYDVLLTWSKLADRTSGMIRLDNLHSTHKDFLDWSMSKLADDLPDLIVLGELFASAKQQKAMTFDQRVHLMLATPWESHYVPDLRSQVEYIHRVFPQQQFILPISSHDSGTPTQEFYDVRATIPRYAVSALMNVGSTGMCQGVEHGAPTKLDFIKHQGRVEIQGPRSFRSEITELNTLMKDFETLRYGGNLVFIDHEHGAILAAHRRGIGEETDFVVVVNMDLHHEQRILLHPDGGAPQRRRLTGALFWF